MGSPTQNLGPIGSAVLTFIGYKQADRQTSKVYIQIWISLSTIVLVEVNISIHCMIMPIEGSNWIMR